MSFRRVLALFIAFTLLGAGCGRIRVNRTLQGLTQESTWQPQAGATPHQAVKHAIGQCYAAYLDHREFDSLSAPLLFNAYDGCMIQNGYVRVVDIPYDHWPPR